MLEFRVGADRIAGPGVSCPTLVTDCGTDYRLVLHHLRIEGGAPVFDCYAQIATFAKPRPPNPSRGAIGP